MIKPFFAAVFLSALLAAALLMPPVVFAEGLRSYDKEAFKLSQKSGKTIFVGVYANW